MPGAAGAVARRACLAVGLAVVLSPLLPAPTPRELPVVDISALMAGGRLGPLGLRALRAAATRLGAFRVVGHGVEIDRVLNASRAFFELPLATKRAVRGAQNTPSFQRGYIGLGGESGLASYLELKEGFCYGYEWGADEIATATPNALSGHNSWPPDHALGPAWRARLVDYFTAAGAVAAAASRGIAQALGGADALLESSSGGETISLMRLFHYFPADQFAELAPDVPRTGSSPHTDWHFLTVILQDTTGGLQLIGPDGEWIDVPAERGELIVLLGDYTALLTAGATRSPVHRVLLPRGGAERHSLTYFHYAPYGATVRAEVADAAARAAGPAGAAQRSAGAPPRINTLVNWSDAAHVRAVAAVPFGELMERKWRGVSANAIDSAAGARREREGIGGAEGAAGGDPGPPWVRGPLLRAWLLSAERYLLASTA